MGLESAKCHLGVYPCQLNVLLFLFLLFSGVGWESILLKGDEAASDATETSSADMTVKVRDVFFSSVLKEVHPSGKRAPGRLLGAKRARPLNSAGILSLLTGAAVSQPDIRFSEVWHLG